MISPAYRAHVDLLIRILPHIAEEPALALKGGTAINLFVRDMPRFSVDIDLTYVPFESKTVSGTFFPKRAQVRTRKVLGASPPAGLMSIGR